MEKMILFHGSRSIISQPRKDLGRSWNDYGQGFYCTKEESLAGEWACSEGNDGFVNRYELDLDHLNVLVLDSRFNILNWLAVLLENRKFDLRNPLAADARQYLLKHFSVPYRDCDVLIGYRADDSYFSFAQDFLSNQISILTLSRAMVLGKLGLQVFLQSEKAFGQIRFLSSRIAPCRDFFPAFRNRDEEARERYLKDRNEPSWEGLFVRDLMKEGIADDDQRIPRIVLE